MRGAKGFIFAAEEEDCDQMLRTIKHVELYASAIKVGNIALLSHGVKVISEIRRVTSKPIIADVKLGDIPFYTERVASILKHAGADGVLMLGLSGFESMCACKEVFSEGYVFVLSQYTHCSGMIGDDTADDIIHLARAAQCDVVVPGTRPERIARVREQIGEQAIIVSCGIGAQGPEIGTAICAGSDYEIIGRAIYDQQPGEITATNAARALEGIRRAVERYRNLAGGMPREQ